ASRKFQVGKRLRLTDRRQGFNGLNLYNNRLFHQQVHAVTAFQLDLFINKWYGFLFIYGKSSFAHLVCQTRHVSGLEQPGSQYPMNLDRCANDGLRDLVQSLPLGHCIPAARRKKFNTENTRNGTEDAEKNSPHPPSKFRTGNPKPLALLR